MIIQQRLISRSSRSLAVMIGFAQPAGSRGTGRSDGDIDGGGRPSAVASPQGATRVWLPIPSVDSGYQKTLDNAWSGNAQTAKIVHDGTYGAGMLYAEWPTAEKNPVIELYSRFATRDRAVDFSARPESVERLSPGQRAFYTGSTEHMPTDGIVKRTAQDITKGARTDYDKAKAIYEWIVENTYRDPKTRGCGVGDIKTMLETGNLGGKCADLNALYVGLARASGLPARDVYGVRVAKSQFGYRSLGDRKSVV